MKWVTRERPKIDRIACPWLIRRFIEPGAEFLYVPADQVFAVAAETGAVPYDIPGAEPFSHDGERCSFDAFLKHYGLNDPALHRLATIVRGADTARPNLAPQAAGLLAISLGLSANYPDDQLMLKHGMMVYDALYTWCRNLQHDAQLAAGARGHVDPFATILALAAALALFRFKLGVIPTLVGCLLASMVLLLGFGGVR